MLLRQDKKLRRPLTFDQERIQLKDPVPIVDKDEKASKNYELTLTILDLLMDKSPNMADSLLVVKKSLGKWYDHVHEEKIAKAREIYNLREKLVVRIRKEVGIVLEEIAYYLRGIMEEYNDQNLERFYAKYLLALKKL